MRCPNIWLSNNNIISVCLLQFQKRLAFELVGWVQQIDHPNVDGHHPLSNWVKQEDRGRLALPSLCLTTQLRHQASPVLTAPGSQEIWIRSYTISLLALRPSTYTTSLPEPPACRWQIVDFLSLHNHMSQLLVINPPFLSLPLLLLSRYSQLLWKLISGRPAM